MQAIELKTGMKIRVDKSWHGYRSGSYGVVYAVDDGTAKISMGDGEMLEVSSVVGGGHVEWYFDKGDGVKLLSPRFGDDEFNPHGKTGTVESVLPRDENGFEYVVKWGNGNHNIYAWHDLVSLDW